MRKNTGKFKFGQFSTNRNQVKKHISQMTNREVDTILKNLHSLTQFQLADHLLDKVENDGLSFQPASMVAVLKRASRKNIVEYSILKRYRGTDRRVLFRSEEVYLANIEGVETECNLCFVLSLDTGDVVTAYWNAAEDNHNTINWSNYNGKVAVI